MMRKIFFSLIIFWLLAGCAPAVPATPTVTPVSVLIATPAVGAVTVISMPPGQASLVLVAAHPEMSVSLGKVKIGDTGKIIGVEASGKWMLVEIKQQTGWLPIQYLDYIIAQ